MNLSDEIKKLQELNASGALNDDEFAQAKAAVLARASNQPAGNAAPVESHLRAIELQNDVARLDREWQMERENYMVTGKYGARYVPSVANSVLVGILCIGFGIVWLIATSSSFNAPGSLNAPGVFGYFPFFGVIMIGIGVVFGLISYSKATRYEEALRRYQESRARLLAQQDAAE